MSAIANSQREILTGSDFSQRFGNAIALARKSFSVNETNKFAAIGRLLTFLFYIFKLKEIAFVGKMESLLECMKLPIATAIPIRSRNRSSNKIA